MTRHVHGPNITEDGALLSRKPVVCFARPFQPGVSPAQADGTYSMGNAMRSERSNFVRRWIRALHGRLPIAANYPIPSRLGWRSLRMGLPRRAAMLRLLMLCAVATSACGTPDPNLVLDGKPWEPLDHSYTPTPVLRHAFVASPDTAEFEEALEGVSMAWIPGEVTDHGKIGYLRFAPNVALRPQTHSFDVRIVVLEGSLSIRADGADPTRIARAGYSFLPGGDRYSLAAADSGGALAYVESNGSLAYFLAELKTP